MLTQIYSFRLWLTSCQESDTTLFLGLHRVSTTYFYRIQINNEIGGAKMVHAVDWDDDACEALVRTISTNSLDDRVTVNQGEVRKVNVDLLTIVWRLQRKCIDLFLNY